MPREVILVDSQLGNLDSVEHALIQVGASVIVSSDPDRVATARMVVFPGQGSFGPTTRALVDGAMGAALRMVIERGDPFLGICLGMQLLFEHSEESGGFDGLKVLPGRVRRFPADMRAGEDPESARLKIPHMGWSDVQPTGEHFYFAHSYYVETTDPSLAMWWCRYGSVEFPATIARGNVFGCQFHPEKSQWSGLRFLRSFILGGRA
ncbi:imidazole glycerol phosphate synthase subunit HisH [Nannocystis sp. SCPEA4]|uniref:imidazole glycerol phosphate synthase subunit HisH n=1 Tax=Nannocystis sp. SCPEA4 TaxID=2996787 RepID=UPI002270F1A1|nr:imidazole glycerol phosphate synthase subunit HisH [Nannocystis sp. SCPEA4]MCY1061057.1 imidazole glycerol phosphate synthase subunit HisH [Nannocystis sp. SCPEA4]